MGDIMNKKMFFTIILISILSIACIQANPISAFDNGMNVDFDSNDFDSKDVVYEDDDSLYNDFGYYDVDYSTNTNNDPFDKIDDIDNDLDFENILYEPDNISTTK